MPDTLSKASVPSADLGNATSETLFTNTSAATLTVTVPVLDNLNKPLRVRAGGRITTGTAQNFTAKIYFSTTTGATTLIATGVTALIADQVKLWMLDGVIGCTESNPTAAGTIEIVFLNSAGTAATAIETNNPALTGAVVSVSGQFASSSSSNSAFCDFFEVQGMVS